MPSNLTPGSRLAFRLLLAGLLAALLVALLPTPALAADVHGDDDGDRYVGTGGLLLPGSVGESTRAEVAACAGCAWRTTSPCEASDAGTPFDGQGGCRSVVRGCTGGDRLLRAWFRPTAGAWRDVGLLCVGPGGPVTVAEVGRRLDDQVAVRVPPASIAFQPPRGAVTQVPVVFDSGQPGGARTWRLEVLGRTVDLVATPRWTWRFADGAVLHTEDPGGPYPHLAVAHAYRSAGTYRVELATTWSATFAVDGLGPFPVAEEVSQRQAVLVPVGEGRAVLAPAALPAYAVSGTHGTMASNHGP